VRLLGIVIFTGFGLYLSYKANVLLERQTRRWKPRSAAVCFPTRLNAEELGDKKRRERCSAVECEAIRVPRRNDLPRPGPPYDGKFSCWYFNGGHPTELHNTRGLIESFQGDSGRLVELRKQSSSLAKKYGLQYASVVLITYVSVDYTDAEGDRHSRICSVPIGDFGPPQWFDGTTGVRIIQDWLRFREWRTALPGNEGQLLGDLYGWLKRQNSGPPPGLDPGPFGTG